MTTTTDVIEIDCPWFDAEWLVDHPEFPLASTLVGNNDHKEEAA